MQSGGQTAMIVDPDGESANRFQSVLRGVGFDCAVGANLNQALFFGNAGVVEGLLKPAPGNLTDRLTKMSDSQAVADELYLAVFGRRPMKSDEAAVAEFLKDRQDRAASIQELTWSLMSSNEFRFNH
jgi:hypothetical protein